MILVVIAVGIIAFCLGWYLKDYSWTKASKLGRFKCVDGELYTVHKYKGSKIQKFMNDVSNKGPELERQPRRKSKRSGNGVSK